MKILLILAAIPEVKPAHSICYPILAPPMTLPLLEAVCKRSNFEVELMDTRYYMKRDGREWQIDYEALERDVRLSTATVAGVSFLSSSAKLGFFAASLCRKYGKTVIGGGLHASVAPRDF